MSNKIKKIISIIIVTVIISIFGGFAAIGSTNYNNLEYCSFIQSNARMEADGSFGFTMRWSIQSAQNFTARSNYISINTRADIWDAYNGNSYTDSSKYYRVTLYRVGWGQVGTYLGCADNVYGGVTFTNVVQGASYYFIISGESALPDNCYFDGYGRVVPVTVQW